MYQIAISDLDGTLLAPNHKITQDSINGVKEWIANGKKFAIATGRHFIEAKNIQQQIDLPMYIISSNGARVHNTKGQLIHQQNLPSEIAQYICDQFSETDTQVNLFTDEHWHANFTLPELAEIRLGEGFNCTATDLNKVDKSNIIKAFFWGERDKLELVYNKIQKKYGNKVNLTFSLNRCLEVMEANTNKATAIKAVLDSKGLNVEQCIAFGDGMNDLEMLQYVGRPIVMDNAQKALKGLLADIETTLSSKEHGVVIKLREILQEQNDS